MGEEARKPTLQERKQRGSMKMPVHNFVLQVDLPHVRGSRDRGLCPFGHPVSCTHRCRLLSAFTWGKLWSLTPVQSTYWTPSPQTFSRVPLAKPCGSPAQVYCLCLLSAWQQSLCHSQTLTRVALPSLLPHLAPASPPAHFPPLHGSLLISLVLHPARPPWAG